MRELQLLSDYLVRLRQEKLQQAHAHALKAPEATSFTFVAIRAHEAELCDRIHTAIAMLDKDPGKFIQDYLPQRQQ